MSDPGYGVPTGGVPRTSGFLRDLGPAPAKADPLLAVIDRQLEIERKARAWDKMRAQAVAWHQPEVVAEMDALVHPAPTVSTGKPSAMQDAERK